MSSGYVNPIGKGLRRERTDMGVDFGGAGPIMALGKARIVQTSEPGWPGGGYLRYQLLDGPQSGRYVYVAENFAPSVRVGQIVNPGDVIGRATGGHFGIETGWADARGETLSVHNNTQSHSGDPGAKPTPEGLDFAKLLDGTGSTLGAGGAGGTPDPGGPSVLTDPAGALVHSLASAFGAHAARIGLYIVLIAGGVLFLVTGIARTAGVTRGDVTKTAKLGALAA